MKRGNETVSKLDDYLPTSDIQSAARVNRVVGLAGEGSKCNRQACCLLKSIEPVVLLCHEVLDCLAEFYET